jgi:23S rRNA pseudouridine1911/1915/1917 synthase
LRLDRFLVTALPDLSRTRIQALIAAGHVQSAGKPVKANAKLNGGEEIAVTVPAAEPSTLAAEDIALTLIYDDRDVAVIDKPAGLTVHPSSSQKSGTLVNALLARLDSLSGIGGVQRPGIVHRLDKNTSGLIIVAKNDRAHEHLVKAFARREVKKTYLAWVIGKPPDQGSWSQAIGRHPKDRKRFSTKSTSGKASLTHFKVLERYTGAAKLELDLMTGRTHQIRVHASDAGFPLIGDTLYGARVLKHAPFFRQALHAHVLALTLPSGKHRRFVSPVPADLIALEDALREA